MTDKQYAAMDLLLMGKSTDEVGKAIGVRRETVWRWTKDPDFVAQIEDARTERRARLSAALEDAAQRAAEVLVSGLDESAPWSVRLRAAESILSRSGVKP